MGQLTRTVKVGGHTKQVSIRLPNISSSTVTAQWTGSAAKFVQADLQLGGSSAGAPSLQVCHGALCTYGWDIYQPGQYVVVLDKRSGPAVAVKLRVSW